MSLPNTDDAGVVQTSLDGAPVVWDAGLGYDADGNLCVTNTTSASDVYVRGRRVSEDGLLVITDSTSGAKPFVFNAGWPMDKTTGATIAQADSPSESDPRVAGVAIGPLGGVYMTEGPVPSTDALTNDAGTLTLTTDSGADILTED